MAISEQIKAACKDNILGVCWEEGGKRGLWRESKAYGRSWACTKAGCISFFRSKVVTFEI